MEKGEKATSTRVLPNTLFSTLNFPFKNYTANPQLNLLINLPSGTD